MEADTGADAAILQAAIEIADRETATERASFYAYARRGRPEATAQVSRTVEVRHRGQAYRIVVSQLAPNRYRTEVDGAVVEVTVERLSGHERRIIIAGVTHRAIISRQGADLLVEVHGVPHRISRDDGGFVRSGGPSVVVAIPVNEGDEVAEGDVVAVVESMKMETSLVAPFAGRVRRVLSGTNVQVPARTPLLQLEAIEDDASDDAAERVEFESEALRQRRQRRDRPPALRDARLRRVRRRGPPRARRPARVRHRRHRRRAQAAGRLHRRARADARPPRRPRARAPAQPAGVHARVPALAGREGRAAPGALRHAARSARSRTTAWKRWTARPRSRTPATGCSSPRAAPTSPAPP